MFGGNNMMKKLQEMQQKVEETKARLDTITVEGKASNGKVSVIMTGNRKVNSISINEEIASLDKEELEDLLIIATNDALVKAESVNESEMKAASAGMLPGM
ncbi:YbaB/EbfC family nucleoid-associated protein [Flavobacteriales bacterium]|nr:YbaB/EbfC family nucleoid-associated protein [Flavobacteriales bacterium]